MDREPTNGQMENLTKVGGLTVSNTDKVNLFFPMESKNKVFGKTERDNSGS